MCSAETCTLLFSQPSGTGPAIAFGASSGTPIYIADPSGTTVSDKISVAANPATLVCPPTGGPCTFSGLQVLFTSDDSGTGSTFGTCASVGGCQITENGLVQTAVTLFSESGTCPGPNCMTFATDTINFSSTADAPAVPEPSSFLLLGVGLVGLIALSRKRLA